MNDESFSGMTIKEMLLEIRADIASIRRDIAISQSDSIRHAMQCDLERKQALADIAVIEVVQRKHDAKWQRVIGAAIAGGVGGSGLTAAVLKILGGLG